MHNKYYAAFGAVPNIRMDQWHKLISYFPDLEKAWEAKTGDLLSAGLSEKWIDNFLDFKNRIGPDEIMEGLEEHKVNILTLDDAEYPALLKEIYNPPFVIYIKGEFFKRDENAIAIVGSRKGTDYGKRATKEIAGELARAGITIVSGLALGLDAEAHRGALEAEGRSIAVLANGLDSVHPTSNNELARRLLENGCIISEQPLGMAPLKQNFPARNRIISGLSLGVLITEAGEHSGTLHTASFALEQNRQMYAIPGPIYNPLAKGPNNLIKNGAKPVTCAGDILEDFGIEENSRAPEPEGEEEELIFEILRQENLHIDEITKKAKKEAGEISKILTMMEIKGKVRHLGGMVYSLK